MPFQKDASLRKSMPKTNVFIKNLDPSTTSSALHDAFAPFGQIVSCKVAGDEYTPNHRGFGYVNYETPEAAEDAIGNMNGSILNGRSIFVGHHISKRDRLSKIEELKVNFTNLYVKNIESHVTEKEFQDLFAQYGELVSNSLPLDDEGLSRGFGFINFQTHDQAVAAIEALNDYELHGKKLYVSRAQKKYEREEELRVQYETARLRRIAKYAATNLYIKYLDPSIDDAMLCEAFSPFGTITSARVMTDDNGVSRGFGFVCYSTSEEAQRAIGEMHNREFKGKHLFVSIAQRRDNRKTTLLPLHPFFANGMGQGPLTHIPSVQQSPPQTLGDQSPQKQSSSLNSPQTHHSPSFNQNRQIRGQTIPISRGMPLGAPGQFISPYYYPMASNFLPNTWNRTLVGPNGEPIMFPSAYGYPMMALPNNGNYRQNNKQNSFNGNNNGSKQGSRQGQWKNNSNKQNGNSGQYQGKSNPQLSYGSTLSAVVASAASPEAEKQAIGEALYPRIYRHAAVKGDAEMSAKLTGMMLDLDTTELLKWVDDDAILNAHIQQAYDQYQDFLASSSSKQ